MLRRRRGDYCCREEISLLERPGFKREFRVAVAIAFSIEHLAVVVMGDSQHPDLSGYEWMLFGPASSEFIESWCFHWCGVTG